ncbi:MAG: DegT/DnrJ/EryC1/StrS family aminotransferase [Thermodesulfobacteriota bacterium]
MEKIEFFKHNLTEEDIDLASQVMRSIFLTTGPMVAQFEKKFARYLDSPEAVGLTSCTGAMHLALLRQGIGPGDEVITTPMTFVATTTAIIETGATPVLVDVCPRSGLLLPEAVDAAVSPRTRGILPVHLYGRMVDMRGLARVAAKHGLAVIEDAAHCLEGSRDGVRPGQLSAAACFSFYPTKSMTCGEGGALVCRTPEDADWYRAARHHGISKHASSRYTKKYEHWDMEMMGWKYNMDDIQAALLLNQIGRLDGYRRKRQDLERLYRELLAEVEGLDFLEAPGPGEVSGHHLFTVLLPPMVDRDEAIKLVQEQGVGCAVNYRAVHVLRYFQETYGYRPEDFPTAYQIGQRTISLPLYPQLTEAEVARVCDTLKKAVSSRP